MRTALSLLVVLSACSTAGTDAESPPASVRERLELPTRMMITADESGGTITAERKLNDGWQTALVDLPIENGEITVSADSRDAVTLEHFQVMFKPLDMPEGMFGARTAQLTNVHFDLANEQRIPAVWTSDDEVHLAANLQFTMSWTLSLDGSPAPLGAPHLPPVPVDVVLTGDGAHVQAELRLNAPGELWNWATVVKLSDLKLVLGAEL